MRRFTLFTLITLLLLAVVHGVWATTYTFKTSDNKLDTVDNSNNSGWWSDTDPNVTSNDNYVVGFWSGFNFHNFFSFDLTALDMTNMRVASAKLVAPPILPYGGYEGQDLMYSLYDVSTDVNTLNDTFDTNSTIYDDLSSGVSYGSYAINPTDNPQQFSLNSAACTAIGSKGWFSIGGSLTGGYIFLGTYRSVVSLEVTTVPVPEPSSLITVGFPVLMIGLSKLRRLRK